MITFIRKDAALAYPACPSENCNKKVTDEGANRFHCEKCGKTYPSCQWRYTLSVQVSDHTGSIWATVFNPEGEELFGEKAENMVKWRNEVRRP